MWSGNDPSEIKKLLIIMCNVKIENRNLQKITLLIYNCYASSRLTVKWINIHDSSLLQIFVYVLACATLNSNIWKSKKTKLLAKGQFNDYSVKNSKIGKILSGIWEWQTHIDHRRTGLRSYYYCQVKVTSEFRLLHGWWTFSWDFNMFILTFIYIFDYCVFIYL